MNGLNEKKVKKRGNMWNMFRASAGDTVQEPERKKESCRHGIDFYKMFWLFFGSCILGYVLEIIYCYIKRGHIESRQGLLYGPFSPVYGFGAVIMAFFLLRLEKQNVWSIFACSALIGGVFEYFCSLFQEIAFGTISWDYSKKSYSIGGRTTVTYMFFWGILGVLLVKLIWPALSLFVMRMPQRRRIVVTLILASFMCVNIIITSMAVARWSERRSGIPAGNPVAAYLDKQYPDTYLREIYPNMKEVNKK